jgi:hypothetical protein
MTGMEGYSNVNCEFIATICVSALKRTMVHDKLVANATV